MNIKQLQQAWVDFHKTAVYEGVRFGQYVDNEYNYKFENSYFIEYNSLVYGLLFNSLTNNLNEVM